MSETVIPPTEPATNPPAVPRPRRNRWQVGLRTMFLLMIAIAVWIAFFVNRWQNAVLEARIKAVSPLAHELMIDDATKIAVVKLEELWYDENRWDLFLPAGQYRLCLATRDIDQAGMPPVLKSAPLKAGRHRLALEQQPDKNGWRVAVQWDDSELLAVEEPKEWDPATGSEGGSQYSDSTQLPADQPAVLFRRRFTRRDASGQTTTPGGPTEGVLMWIERMPGSNAQP